MADETLKSAPRPQALRAARRKLFVISALGCVLIAGAVGVRNWWARTAPERAARLADLERRRREELALSQARDEVTAHPQAWMAHNRLAEALIVNRLPDQALLEWRRAAELAPNQREPWIILANGYLVQKRFVAAEETYRKVAAKWPTDPSGANGLAVVQRHTGRLQEALVSARTAVRLAPGRPEPQYVMGSIIQEIGVRSPFPQGQTGLLEEGRKALLTAARGMPGNPDVDYRRGRICLLIRRYDEAREALEKAAAQDPIRGVVWISLSEARLRTGKVDDAIAAARQAAAANPLDPEAHSALGRALLLKSDRSALEGAAKAFSDALKLSPKNVQAAQKLGTALLRLDRVQESGAAFEVAYRLDPNDPYPAQQLAQLYQRIGKSSEAAQMAHLAGTLAINERLLSQLQRSSSSQPNNPLMHRALAERYRELGWDGAAADEYQQALRYLPGDPRSAKGLAAVRAKLARQTSP